MMRQESFRILLLGDFSGRDSRPGSLEDSALADRRIRSVDRDNYEEVLAELRPSLCLSWDDGGQVPLSFGCMDDFHPDRLCRELDVFAPWRSLRSRLQNPTSFAAAAAELRGHLPGAAESLPTTEFQKKGRGVPGDPPSIPIPGSLLRQALAQTNQDLPRERRDVDAIVNWELFLRQYVDPISIARPDPQLPELIQAVDTTAAGILRNILHHPQLQALEAAWRGVEFLVRRVTSEASLKIFLLDVSQPELLQDGTENSPRCQIEAQLVHQAVGRLGGRPWNLVLGNYYVQPEPAHFAWLQRMGEVATAAQAPFLLAATPQLLGCPSSFEQLARDGTWQTSSSWNPAWQTLRTDAAMKSIGLAAPRFLLRRPYGTDTDPISPFAFEEMDPLRHESYLWGNPIFLAAYLWGESAAREPTATPGLVREVHDLPVHLYQDDGDKVMKPCAEVYLTEQTVQHCLSLGIMPVLSYADQARVRWPRFCNVAGEEF